MTATTIQRPNAKFANRKPSFRKKKRRARDPNAPKRPTTAFFFYCQETRDETKRAHPNANVATLAKLMGSAWNSMTPSERAPFVSLAEDDKRRYQRDLDAYEPPPPAVKRARSAYLFYCMDARPALVNEYPDEQVPEIGARLGAAWNALSEEEKAPFVAKSIDDKLRYQQEIAERAACEV